VKRVLGLKWPYAAALALTGLTIVVLRVFFFRPFDAPSVSMVPGINQGDYFLVALRAYASRDPERGDVVVFNAADGAYVKRVAGIPGDRVQMKQGVLFLNGKAVPRRRVEDLVDDYQVAPGRVAQYLETLPSGRSYRTVDIAVTGLDEPPEYRVPAGHYFVLGDNRDNSNDSRLDVGFVAREDIVGRAAVKYIDGRTRSFVWTPVN
jgi:signal peptidase I